MSMMRSETSAARTLMAPLVPAATIAEFATIAPSIELSVDTPGYACPAGQTARYGKPPRGTLATFSTYACAAAGIPQVLRIGMSRVAIAASDGGPNAPVTPCPARVSTALQGA